MGALRLSLPCLDIFEVGEGLEEVYAKIGSVYLPQVNFKPIWRGAYLRGGLFNLEKMMVPVLHKELECKVEKLKYKKVRGHAAEDQNQIRTSSW